MSAISKVLREAGDGGGGDYRMLLFFCPGCKEHHGITVSRPAGQEGPTWGYNGNPDKPTFTPSLLVWWDEMSEAGREKSKAFYAEHGRYPSRDELPYDVHKVCHSFVTDGRIQFLGDCWHELANQTVDLPEKWEPGQ